ncbi:hypothetical protein GGX14DRAFT_169923, partial [Mycena pura]
MTDVTGYGERSASPLLPVQRGPKACTNCRRRKIKCDAARPVCNQCRTRPPRSKQPCEYPRPEGYVYESPTQMLDTISALRARIEELEYLGASDPTNVYLNLGGLNLASGRTTPTQMLEPPTNIITTLLDIFLTRFVQSGIFFLDAERFRQAVLIPLPFGHRDRPSPALLSAVYLWGSVLSQGHVPPHSPYTPAAFIACILQNIPQDLASATASHQRLLDTIQAEVLLAFYYLYAASPVPGRAHAAAAASLALGANLHTIRAPSPVMQTSYPPFSLAGPVFPPARNAVEEAQRIHAFWAVVIINNYWVGTEGSPSAVPYSIPVDTPWPGSSQSGSTVTKFLAGNDSHGSSSVALLAKASILLERIIAFSARTTAVGPPDPTALASLDRRLHTFQAALPPLPGVQILVLTHALVDCAILRLHAPHTRASASARTKCLAA